MNRLFLLTACLFIFIFSCSIIEEDYLDSNELREGKEFEKSIMKLRSFQVETNVGRGLMVSFNDQTDVSPSEENYDNQWNSLSILNYFINPDTAYNELTGETFYRYYRNTKSFLNIIDSLSIQKHQNGDTQGGLISESSISDWGVLKSNFEFDNQKRITKINNKTTDESGTFDFQAFEFNYSEEKITQLITRNYLNKTEGQEKLIDNIIYSDDRPVRIEREIYVDNILTKTATIDAVYSESGIQSVTYSEQNEVQEYSVSPCGVGCNEISSSGSILKIEIDEGESTFKSLKLTDYRFGQDNSFLQEDIHRMPDAYLYHPFHSLLPLFKDSHSKELMILYLPDWWYINSTSIEEFTNTENEYIESTYEYQLR